MEKYIVMDILHLLFAYTSDYFLGEFSNIKIWIFRWGMCTCLVLLTYIGKLSSRNVVLHQFSHSSAVSGRVCWPTEVAFFFNMYVW